MKEPKSLRQLLITRKEQQSAASSNLSNQYLKAAAETVRMERRRKGVRG